MTDSDVNVILQELRELRKDHDVIVNISSDVKWANQKLNKYCDKLDALENNVLILQTEHNSRKNECTPNTGLSGRQKTGLLTALGTAIVALIMALIEYLKG